jgi:hypothetical protein
MKQLRITLLLIIVCVALCACPKHEDGHRFINFANNSNNKIAYQFSFDKILNIAQDTIYYCPKTTEGFINSNSTFTLECPIRVNGWESDLNNLYYIQFLVLDEDKFTQYYAEPCDTISKYVSILHCYRLTLADLQQMDWTVVYPPEE